MNKERLSDRTMKAHHNGPGTEEAKDLVADI